jgi:hypothetical protein
MVDGADVSLRLKTRSFRSFFISHMTTYFLAGSQHVNLFLYQWNRHIPCPFVFKKNRVISLSISQSSSIHLIFSNYYKKRWSFHNNALILSCDSSHLPLFSLFLTARTTEREVATFGDQLCLVCFLKRKLCLVCSGARFNLFATLRAKFI